MIKQTHLRERSTTVEKIIDVQSLNDEPDNFLETLKDIFQSHKKELQTKTVAYKKNLCKEKTSANVVEENLKNFIFVNEFTIAGWFKTLSDGEYNGKTLYPNMMILLELILIMPSSTAEVEQGFSVMKLLCTRVRASMKQTTLDCLVCICLHKELEDADFEEIVNIYRDCQDVSSRHISL